MTNMSDANVTLQEVNDAIAVLLIPAMVYTGVTMITGLLGNFLVAYLFPMKMSAGTQNTLITWLAVFDLLICLVSMPMEIIDMRFYYMFESEFACKMLRFVNTFCAMCSIATLILIAIDRYRKVCRPHQVQLGLKQVKMAIAVCILTAAICAWPAAVVYGIRTTETRVKGLIGRDCSTSDAVKNTHFPLLYNGVLSLLFFVSTIVLCVLYTFVWQTAKRHTKPRVTSIGASKAPAVASVGLSSADSGCGPSKTNPSSPIPRTTTRSSHKTTTIALFVTIVFILSFLPYLSLVIARAVVKDIDYTLNGAGTVFYNIFIRSYFVNSAANPIIYGIMNVRFRRECTTLLKNIFCCGRKFASTIESS